MTTVAQDDAFTADVKRIVESVTERLAAEGWDSLALEGAFLLIAATASLSNGQTKETFLTAARTAWYDANRFRNSERG